MLTEPERDALLARLATALEGLDTQRETGWFDRKQLVTALLVMIVGWAPMYVGGIYGDGGMRERVKSAIDSGALNAAAILKVDGDSKERDKEIEERFWKAFGEHKDAYHSGRRSSAAVNGGSSTAAEPIVIRRPTPGELRAMMAAHGSGR